METGLHVAAAAVMALMLLGLGLLAGYLAGRRRGDIEKKWAQATWDLRFDAALKGWHSECDVLRKAAEGERAAFGEERAAWAAERRELCTRIQCYDPAAGDDAKAPFERPGSQPPESTEGPRIYNAEELQALGLELTEDGVIYDRRSGGTFETVEDWKYYINDLRKKGLPLNTNPQVLTDEGVKAAVTAARSATAEGFKG
jgi:hypothetical protein